MQEIIEVFQKNRASEFDWNDIKNSKTKLVKLKSNLAQKILENQNQILHPTKTKSKISAFTRHKNQYFEDIKLLNVDCH